MCDHSKDVLQLTKKKTLTAIEYQFIQNISLTY